MALDNRTKKPTEEPNVQSAIENIDTTPVSEDEVVLTPPSQEVIDNALEEEPIVDDPIDEEIPIDEAFPEEPEQKPKQEPEQSVPEIDYKQRYTESTKEGIILFAKNKQLTDTITDASNLPEPTEEELKVYARANGAEYDELDEFSRNILKKTYVGEKRFEKINEVSNASRALDVWVDKVEAFLNDPANAQKYPEIIANEDEFKSYCLKSKMQNIDLDLLSASFLYSRPKKANMNGSLLLNRGTNKEGPAKPKEMTIEDLTYIRQHDQARYKELIKSGIMKKIKVD
jgi:hypothetical protein